MKFSTIVTLTAAALSNYASAAPAADFGALTTKAEIVPRYLKDAQSAIKCGSAARTCTRVWCDGGAAIEICNDLTSSITVPCQKVADAADSIAKDCRNHASLETTRGQWFDTVGYNIVVRYGGCNNSPTQPV
ncbi:hypothetical protein H072_443 [Dactylellina haptotyla CBS 200.50]|uniref:Uncharacterized protein n=1 Tax=Dactylellina haptotyla (strain CBS 200.50) TaxID=1284197 RepID=S8ARC4_DACHA|nr:hypothetical protein H072_443 [Dactylellina haptotyla CBS 200.50]